LEREALQTLGMGAIFHDVGKFLVPDHILNKPGKLTDEEFRIMKTHAPLGAEHLLENNKELTDGMIDIVRHHHERMDGSGYPDGLKAENISDFSVISAMCDVYDALSSDRVYHKGMVPHEALKVVFSLRGRHFPEAWTDRFVQCIGIYPPGTAVKMNNGEVGVVIQVNYASLVKPRLIVVLDSKGRRMAIERNVDLTEPAHHGLDIVKIMDAKALGIDPAKYFPGA
jgi:HD-GYP domain-containing protein (c-di-GMP phosphodiesterase class II)